MNMKEMLTSLSGKIESCQQFLRDLLAENAAGMPISPLQRDALVALLRAELPRGEAESIVCELQMMWH